MGRRRILVVGAGTGGSIVANLLARRTGLGVTVVSQDANHLYQPGLLYVPFGWVSPAQLVRPQRPLLHPRIRLIQEEVRELDPLRRVARLNTGEVAADAVVLATGARLAPEEVPGLEDAHHFYSPEAALRLREALGRFEGGHIVVGVAGVPYKCPPAPLEFALLLEWELRRTGRRSRTRLTYVSPLPRAFPIESVADVVEPIMADRGIELVPFFNVEQVDPGRRVVSSLEGEEVPYDLLVLIPPHRGIAPVSADGIADRGGWIRTDRETLQVVGYEQVYAIGDATDLPVSKSGSAAHYQARTVAARLMDGKPGRGVRYTGKVMCFLETGEGRATLLRFDYQHPPRPAPPNRAAFALKRMFNRAYWALVPTARV